MDDHRSRKRRHRGRQEEPTPPRHAAERRKSAQPADIGCDTPARPRGRDAAETRVRSHMKAPENGYVYDWLAEVGTEQPAQTHSPAKGLLPQTPGFRHASPERNDEAVLDERTHREKRRDSSDSSLIQPAYEREELPQREKTIGQVASEDQTRHISKKAKKHKQPASSATDGSQSESDQPQRKETFEKRGRHKTKEDRYESKRARKHSVEDDKPTKKKVIKVKRGDAAKASKKAGEDLINGFRSKNVAQDRLTMRPGTGIFKNGRASSPSRNCGLPDLAFSEMQFLKQSSRQPPESEKEVIVSKSGQKTKRERERARNEISNYFVPARHPLQEAGINFGREPSTLPSDAGKTESTSIVRGHHYHPPVSPETDQRNHKVLYEGFSTTRSTPQKFTLPKPKLDQIFIPRPPVNASRKSTSYCTWSESVRSPIVRAKAIMADASRNERGTSPTSRQRIPIPGIYKEIGIQAELDSDVDSPYKPTAGKTRRDGDDSQVVISKPLKPANVVSTHDIKEQNRTEYDDEDSIYQLQADRAVLHDCDPHSDFGRPEIFLETRPESLHTKSPFDPKQDADHARQTAAKQITQTGVGAVDRAQGNSVQPGQIHPDSEVQSIVSRAVLAQQAYIKRRSTPKAAVEEVGGTSEGPALDIDVPNANDSRGPEESNAFLGIGLTDRHRENEASHLLSELVDSRRNEEASQPGQYRSLGPLPESNLQVYGQSQSEYIDAAGYQPNEPHHDRGYKTNECDSHQTEDIATHVNVEPPQLIIPTRGYSTGAAHIPPVQSRTISPVEIMEPIYARQLQSQAFDAQEEQYGLHKAEEQERCAIYLYEGGQWQREPLDAEVPQEYHPIEVEDGQFNYGDMYEGQQDGLDLIDGGVYYGEEQPFDAEAQMHDTAASAGMLFYTPVSGPNTEYQWTPRQRTHFSGAADQSNLGSWERLQSDRVPRELTMQFWRPRRGY